MNTHPRLIAFLVALYPKAWRDQYGEELRQVLDAHPDTAATMVDVIRGAFVQRLRAADPSTILGVGCLLFFVFGVVLTPTSYAGAMAADIRPSGITFPSIRITFFESWVFASLLVLCGCWTEVRRGRGAAWSGAWMTIVAGLPVSIVALLLWVGAVHVEFPALSAAGQLAVPHPVIMMIPPLVRAPESAIWSAIGGWIGRRLRPHNMRSAAA